MPERDCINLKILYQINRNMKKTGNWLLTCLLLCLSCVFAQAQEANQVSGVVKDSTGHPIPSVTVTVKGKQTATVTDNEGKFVLKNVSAGTTLVFSSVGYASQEAKAGFGPVSVILASGSSAGMEEVVVTAMGIKKQARSLGYAVSTVTAKELTQTGSTNFASALYGKASGVKIVSAPGGASSAVSLQIRGVTSIGLNTQPLYVVNGAPIRLMNDLTTGSVSTSNSRIESNGILDLNPEDIESMTILKGASATALYGSEAANGVVVITTKKGLKSKGLGVDLNYVYNTERLGQTPDYQNSYGPGYDAQTNVYNFGATYDGWQTQTDGNVTPIYRAYGQFGPKFDGRTVVDWDGTSRKYEAQKNNYRDFFEHGYNSNANVAISNSSEKGSFRVSYNRVDYKSIMPGSNQYKNIITFTGTLKLSDRVNVDLSSSYNNTYTHNRPEVTSSIFGSYGGYFSRFDNMNTYRSRYKNSLGYKYQLYNYTAYDADQFKYNMRASQVLDYFWSNLENSYNENQNRFINAATLTARVTDDLTVRARVGGDLSSINTIDMEHNTAPASITNSGVYSTTSNTFNTLYGDGMITYAPKVSKDFNFSVSGGGTARKQVYKYLTASTYQGLVTENFFSLVNSYGTVQASSARAEQIDVAAFGLVNLSYKDFLYLEGTGRYESSSTLPPANNSFFYPSVNAGFILSDVVKMPSFVDYAKVRASYGLVGNHPNLYQANVAYVQRSVTYDNSSVLYQYSNPSGFGNDQLQSEQKREAEFGIESRLFNNRLGVDLSYYNNKISKMITTQSVAASTGSTSALVNAGNLLNYGFEASFNAQILRGQGLHWTSNLNFAINRNKLLAVTNGLNELVNQTVDGGYLVIKSKVGDALGNIYTHPKLTDEKGNAIIDANGWYSVNTSDLKYVGNGMAKIVGGWSNSFSYKGFGLDFMIDYRFGGKFVSTARYYQTGAGMFKSTLKYRDAAHGGLAYVTDDANGGDASAAYTLSNGGTRTDGMVLGGVTADGAVNTKVITAASYYLNTFTWEGTGLYENAVYDNSYIKFREVSFSYNLPKKVSSKVRMQNIQLALIGRNLFYIYKTLPQGMDPEAGVGTIWLNQMTDNGGTAAPTRSYGVSLRAQF